MSDQIDLMKRRLSFESRAFHIRIQLISKGNLI